MRWGILSLFVAIILIVVVINATRIERIRADVDNAKNRDVVFPETESLLIRGSNGDKMPKKAYWLSIVPPSPSSSTSSSSVESLNVQSVNSTDYSSFNTDVTTGRITHIYRPDQRAIFSIQKPTSGSATYTVNPVSASSSNLKFMPTGTTAKTMTVIGLPAALVTSNA